MQQSVWRDERTYTVEEYLKAYEGREGRYELVDGKVIKMAAELNLHNYVKTRLCLELDRAVQRSGAPLVVFTNGVTLKIRSDRAREPDLSVAWASDVDYALMTIDAPGNPCRSPVALLAAHRQDGRSWRSISALPRYSTTSSSIPLSAR